MTNADEIGPPNQILAFLDPLCGWCYAFASVLEDFCKKHEAQFTTSVVCGGMVVGDREGPVGDFAKHILHSLPRLQEMSGVAFGQPFIDQLKTEELYLSSVKPSLALCAFRDFKPKETLLFMRRLQEYHFIHGSNLQEEKVYEELAAEFNIDVTQFLDKMHSDDNMYAFRQDMDFTQNARINGYPTIVAVWKQKYYMLCNGYAPIEALEEALSWTQTH